MRPVREIHLPPRISGRRARQAEVVASRLVDACSAPSLQLGGPTLRSLGVTSAIRGEGRTSLAVAFAVVQRKDYGRRSLLVEMDFDHPGLARRLGLDAAPGLSEVVRGEASLEDVVQPIDDGIGAITVGAGSSSAAQTVTTLLSSGLLADIGRKSDVLVGDLPPLLDSPFGPLAAQAFERVVLVVRAGVTPVARVRQAASVLPADPVVLLNGTSTRLPRWIRKISGDA